jgi:hypothetical protein
MRYTVKAYLCTNFAGLMDDLETDNFYEVQDFILENCQKGYNCEVTDNAIGAKNLVFAEGFNEETTDTEDLMHNDDFYADLLMEQREQM